jgi:hypothetical protein
MGFISKRQSLRITLLAIRRNHFDERCIRHFRQLSALHTLTRLRIVLVKQPRHTTLHGKIFLTFGTTSDCEAISAHDLCSFRVVDETMGLKGGVHCVNF